MNIALLKNIVLYFKKCNHSFEPLFVSDKNLTVQNAKNLGLTISNNLTWNTHIGQIITKANKRMYFLILLRKAGVPLLDTANFYCICVRPLLEYCAPLFHHALLSYLNEDLERIQKHALNVISPGHSYRDNLALFGLKTLQKLFQSILSESVLAILSPRHKAPYNLTDTSVVSPCRVLAQTVLRDLLSRQ